MAKRGSGANYDAFMASLTRGGLSPVYAFVGENAYQAHQGLEELRRRFPPESVDTFVGDEPAESIFDQLRTVDLFVARRLVIVLRGDVFLRTNSDGVLFYLEHPSAGSVLALVAEKFDARTRLAKQIIAAGQLVDCPKLYSDRIPDWVKGRFRLRGKTCGAGVAEMLVEELGEDLFALESEIEKLCTYTDQRKQVELADIKALVGHDRRWEVFALTDAVGHRDGGRAVAILVDMLEEGEAPERIVAQLAWQLRRLLSARRLVEAGREEEIARELRVHPRFLQGFLEQVRQFDTNELVRLYHRLGQTDLALKTGRFDRNLALERFVVQACLGKQADAVAGP